MIPDPLILSPMESVQVEFEAMGSGKIEVELHYL
jgi:hypothetical protein